MYSIILTIQRLIQVVFDFEQYILDRFHNSNTRRTVYFDLETTGLNPYHDKIIEYSFMKEDSDYQNYLINELVNPEVKFEHKITQITGIHPEELEDKTNIDSQLDDIINFVNKEKNVYLIAHNCDSFDKLFIMNAIKNYNLMYPHKMISTNNINFIDTLHMAKKLLPRLKNYSLKNLAEHFKIENGKHRALSDTICLRSIYHEFLNIMAKNNPDTVNDYLKHPEKVHEFIY